MIENWFDTKDYNDYDTAVAILRWWADLTPEQQIDTVYFADRDRLSRYALAVAMAVAVGDDNFDTDAAIKLGEYLIAVDEADKA